MCFSGLRGFEITVEHESTSGLTTEVESKWTTQSIKIEPSDNKQVFKKYINHFYTTTRDRHGRAHLVVRFTTTYAISA